MTTTENTTTQTVVSAPVAKVAPRGTKAELIRKHLGLLGEAAPIKDIATAVNAEAKLLGFTEFLCTPQDVSTNKQNGKPKVETTTTTTSETLSFADGMKTLTVVGELGGMEKVAHLLKGIEPLMLKFPDISKFRKLFTNIAQMQGAKDALAILEPAPVVAPPVA